MPGHFSEDFGGFDSPFELVCLSSYKAKNISHKSPGDSTKTSQMPSLQDMWNTEEYSPDIIRMEYMQSLKHKSKGYNESQDVQVLDHKSSEVSENDIFEKNMGNVFNDDSNESKNDKDFGDDDFGGGDDDFGEIATVNNSASDKDHIKKDEQDF